MLHIYITIILRLYAPVRQVVPQSFRYLVFSNFFGKKKFIIKTNTVAGKNILKRTYDTIFLFVSTLQSLGLEVSTFYVYIVYYAHLFLRISQYGLLWQKSQKEKNT